MQEFTSQCRNLQANFLMANMSKNDAGTYKQTYYIKKTSFIEKSITQKKK